MTKKNNIRSIRFSDEIAEMIEQQPGENFTQKFEYLVTRCMLELPAKEKELERIERAIQEKQQELRKLNEKVYEFRTRISRIEDYLINLHGAVKNAYEKEM